MAAVLNMKVTGDDQKLLQRLKELSSIRKGDITEEIAEQLRGSTVARFRSTISPDGKRWKPSIRASQEGGLTLTHTAQLRNSIRAVSDENGLEVGTNVIYAATHQYGDRRTIRPKKARVLRFRVNGRWVSAKQVTVDIPARPFLGISEEDMEAIQDIVEGVFR